MLVFYNVLLPSPPERYQPVVTFVPSNSSYRPCCAIVLVVLQCPRALHCDPHLVTDLVLPSISFGRHRAAITAAPVSFPATQVPAVDEPSSESSCHHHQKNRLLLKNLFCHFPTTPSPSFGIATNVLAADHLFVLCSLSVVLSLRTPLPHNPPPQLFCPCVISVSAAMCQHIWQFPNSTQCHVGPSCHPLFLCSFSLQQSLTPHVILSVFISLTYHGPHL